MEKLNGVFCVSFSGIVFFASGLFRSGHLYRTVRCMYIFETYTDSGARCTYAACMVLQSAHVMHVLSNLEIVIID